MNRGCWPGTRSSASLEELAKDIAETWWHAALLPPIATCVEGKLHIARKALEATNPGTSMPTTHHSEDLAQVDASHAPHHLAEVHCSATHSASPFVHRVAALVVNHFLRLVAQDTISLLNLPKLRLGKPPHRRIPCIPIRMPFCANFLILLIVLIRIGIDALFHL